MKRINQTLYCLVIIASAVAAWISLAVAADSWNMLAPGTEERSRQASASLFRAASKIFEGLALRETKDYPSSMEMFSEAQRLLIGGSKELSGLAEQKEANRSIKMEKLNDSERTVLGIWYNRITNKDLNAEEISILNASDLLRAASVQAAAIAGELEKAKNVPRSDPQMARNFISAISYFLSVGTIATRTFDTSPP